MTDNDWADEIAKGLAPDLRHMQIFIAVELRKARYDDEAAGERRGRAMGWQTIDTAPRDGTLILISDHGFVEISHWHTWRLVRPSGVKESGSWVAPKSLPEGEYEIFEPTHWQPLPDPPNTKGEKE